MRRFSVFSRDRGSWFRWTRSAGCARPWLEDLLDGYDVTLIDVRCAPEELDRRERERGDRPVGLARTQTMVFDHASFDITVDTTRESAEDCAATIVQALEGVPRPKAFERLRHT